MENTYCGELYLAWHRGTLTSQTRTKRGIRKAEVVLKQVEYAMSFLMVNGKPIRETWKEELERLWELLLFNQFHDIAPGSSIARVHARAGAELNEVISGEEALLREMLGQLEQRAAVYNPLGWTRSYKGCLIPAQGCAVLDTDRASLGASVQPRGDGSFELRNSCLVCRIDARGQLLSVKTAGGNREFLNGPGNRLLMFKDVNTCFDAWELGSMYEELPVALEGDVSVSPFADSSGAGLLVKRMLHNSPMTQQILLGHDAGRLEFITQIDWQERHKLLKVAFPVNVYATEAVHEIQFGCVRRPTHRSRQSDKDRYEVCNHRYTAVADGGAGGAVLNDGKYGVNVLGSEIRLTLLKAALMPDSGADRGPQEFTYAFYPFLGSLSDSDVVREARELSEPPILGAPVSLGTEPIFLSRSKNVIVDTIKPADRAENALLVRVYECMGTRTAASFTAAEQIVKIVETDMLEEQPRPLDRDALRHVEFGAFEIKTFLLYLK